MEQAALKKILIEVAKQLRLQLFGTSLNKQLEVLATRDGISADERREEREELQDQLRQAQQDYAAAGIKLTAMPFLIKAVAMSLKAHPVINASIDMAGGQIIYKDYVNVGIAVDTDRGLVVPSLRNADKLCIADIARAVARIAENARTSSFAVEDLRGSTFTISNLGAIGGTYSTPIINPPEVAILLVGRSRKMPVVIHDQVAVRLMMPLSISYDHRLVDGAAAARFLNDVKAYLEAPSRLLLAP